MTVAQNVDIYDVSRNLDGLFISDDIKNCWKYTSTMERIALYHDKGRKKAVPSSESCHSTSRIFQIIFLITLLLTLIDVVQSGKRHHTTPMSSHAHARHLHQRNHVKKTIYLNEFAVNLRVDDDIKATELASKYGFMYKGRIGSLTGWYLFEDKRIYKRSIRSEQVHTSLRGLQRNRFVKIVERMRILRRVKRGKISIPSRSTEGPNDPAWELMWYMHCGGVNNTLCPTSMRISDAWASGYNGANVVVTILDDGIEANHPDLRTNYDANASYDINGMDPDPTPRYDHSNENKHGTRCAGVVAADDDNGVCGVGIAYRARIGGIRMLDGEVTDNVEARSLGYNLQHIDIYSASWGPDDDGKTVEGPGYLAKSTFEAGARTGRGGKGSIFVWASGNGGNNRDTCSCDGYINSIYTIGISSVSQNGKRPWYLESCASTLTTTYSSGELNEGKVITTDLRGSCTYAHTGTSASAPMAAGVIALMLDANQNLTWRDVQHIIVRTSNPFGLQAPDWQVNGAGYNVSHVFGFGLMDALRLTHVANQWRTVPEHKKCLTIPNRVSKTIHPHRPLFLSVEARACSNLVNEINFLEHVILRITLSHSRRGDLEIFLISPAGTKSNILELRSGDRSSAGFNWDFMTTHHWGENPQGLWTLEISDSQSRMGYRDSSDENELTNWQLIFYGTRENPQPNFYYNSCDAFRQDLCHSECDGCCGPTDKECRSCRHVSTFAGACLSACPFGHFPHRHTHICQPCWRTCRECSAALESNCTACHPGFSLVDGYCMKTCAEGYYLDHVSQQCQTCYPLCRTCEERRDRCTSCRQGFEQIEHSCKPSCPSGTYLLSYRDGCKLCHASCRECTGSSSTQCTSCREGLIFHRRQCVASCPRRYYMDTETSTCRLCHDSCKTCSGPKSSDCSSCRSDFMLTDGVCKEKCTDGYEGKYRSYPCLLVIQMKWCNIEIFHALCCHSCSMYETGVLFNPTYIDHTDSYSYDDTNYDSNDPNYTSDYDDYNDDHNLTQNLKQSTSSIIKNPESVNRQTLTNLLNKPGQKSDGTDSEQNLEENTARNFGSAELSNDDMNSSSGRRH